MLRHIAFVTAALAASSVGAPAEETQQPDARRDERNAAVVQRDAFVISGDECGASQYRHLLGREYAQVYQASLIPGDSNVENRVRRTTLEYTPHRLNVVVDGGGRIIAIGCF